MNLKLAYAAEAQNDPLLVHILEIMRNLAAPTIGPRQLIFEW